MARVPPAARSQDVPRTVPLHGLIAGAIGAAVVAVVYLAIDLALGKPFYTPNALGAALFRGESLGLDAPIEPVLVYGYSLVHGGVFAGFGLIASFVELEARMRLSDARKELLITGALALALFVVFQISFGLFGWLLAPGQGQLGGWRAALANALAAIAMAGYLALVRLRYAERIARSDRDATRETAAPARSSSGRN
jgi:hypothetical protein